VREALSQLRAALEEKPAFNPAASRRAFHVLTSDYAEIVLLAPLVGKLREQAAGVSIRVHRPPNVFQPPSRTALSDSFDLAIGFFPDALSLDASVRSEVLFEEDNVCIASANHPSIKSRITIRQYATARHAAVFYKSEGPGVIDTILAQKGHPSVSCARSAFRERAVYCCRVGLDRDCSQASGGEIQQGTEASSAADSIHLTAFPAGNAVARAS
jgi:DNA-binding transcriptional LysR family regulator